MRVERAQCVVGAEPRRRAERVPGQPVRERDDLGRLARGIYARRGIPTLDGAAQRVRDRADERRSQDRRSRPGRTSPTPSSGSSTSRASTPSAPSSRWAPLWAYAVPIVVINLLRQLVVPPSEAGDVVSVALFAATVAIVVLAVTVVHRLR